MWRTLPTLPNNSRVVSYSLSMKKYTFRQIQTNTEWLNELPVQIIRYGKPIAMIVAVTSPLKDKIVESVAVRPTVTKKSINPPFSICPKHKVFYKSCGC